MVIIYFASFNVTCIRFNTLSAVLKNDGVSAGVISLHSCSFVLNT